MPIARTLGSFTLRQNPAQSNTKVVVTLRQNEADSAVTCTVALGGATTCTFSPTSLAVAAGDRLAWKLRTTGNPGTSVRSVISMTFR